MLNRGTRIVFGVREPKRIVGAPAGRQRLRMRNTAAAYLFVLTPAGVRKFALEECGDCWKPICEQGRNIIVKMPQAVGKSYR